MEMCFPTPCTRWFLCRFIHSNAKMDRSYTACSGCTSEHVCVCSFVCVELVKECTLIEYRLLVNLASNCTQTQTLTPDCQLPNPNSPASPSLTPASDQRLAPSTSSEAHTRLPVHMCAHGSLHRCVYV